MASVLKEKSEPSLIFVGIYAAVMVGFGILLGFIYLMSFPLQAYPSMEKRADDLEKRESSNSNPGDAFYIEGPRSGSSAWEAKRGQLVEGSASRVRLSAGEINAWLQNKFRPSAVAEGSESKDLLIEPDSPNIGITEDGAVYLNLPAKISGYGMDGKSIFSAQVHYTADAPPRLSVDRLQIGGAAVPLPGILGSQIVSAMQRAFSSAEEYVVLSKAWDRVQSVEASDGALVLTLETL